MRLATVREDHGVNQMFPRLVESYMNDGMFEPHIWSGPRHQQGQAGALLRGSE